MDSHSFHDMDKELQRVVKLKRQDSEHELEKQLASKIYNPGTTKQEIEDGRKADRENFWKSKYSELQQHKEHAEQTIFKDWGGSREAAQQQMREQQQQERSEQQRQQQLEQRKQQIQDQMRQSWQRQQQQGQDHQAQVLNLMDEKKKKEQQAREEQEQKQQQQRNMEDEKQKRIDYMRNQFNARQRANGRDM